MTFVNLKVVSLSVVTVTDDNVKSPPPTSSSRYLTAALLSVVST
jgi:hypothetical protein